MLQLTFLFVGAVATLATVLTIRTIDDQTAIITGLIGFLTWALWGYSALNVTVYDGSGASFTHGYPALAAMGVMLAIPNLFIALTGPLRIVSDPSKLAEEVN